MNVSLSQTLRVLGLVALAMFAASTQAKLLYVENANGERSAAYRNLIQWTHSRLLFDRDLERVAIGQDKTLEVEILGGRELLILAKHVGKTTLIVWYADGKSETFLFGVTEDLSVLRSALNDIHPALQLEQAPDRQALVLRGRVPTIEYKIAAEAAARHYLGVRQVTNRTTARSANDQLTDNALPIVVGNNLAANTGFKLSADALSMPSRVAIINLIKVDALPKSMEQKIISALQPMGIRSVSVRRIQKSDIADDRIDTLVLEGSVPDQVALTRAINIAARVFLGDELGNKGLSAIKVIADESGSLFTGRTANNGALDFTGGRGAGSLPENNIKANIGRAKMLSIANGRLLSMINVKDLPQVRVSVQIHEINRTKMRQWRPDLSIITQGYSQDGLFGLAGLVPAQQVGSSIENAMQILGGTLTNNLQLASKDVAFDLLFSLMEQEGISKTLSRPTLLVLAGESAVFNVGGEVPVPTAFAPTGLSGGDEVGANTPGVFSGTTFKSFGVKLKVRAMVDENDQITLDLNPEISTPDTLLTQQISGSTGTNLNSSAFNTRSISTTTRLQDGQPLVIGGLIYAEQVDQKDFTPGVRKVPLLGKLAESDYSVVQDRELVLVVTPTLVRERSPDAKLWAFPSPVALAQGALTITKSRTGE